MAEQEYFSGFDSEPEEVSRSAQKREAQAVRKLAEDLAKLGIEAFNALTFPEDEVKQALLTARSLKRNSDERRRQLQYAAKLMRSCDLAPLQQQLSLQGASAAVDPQAMRLEKLRSELIASGAPAINALCALIYDIDRNKLRGLVKRAQQEVLNEQAQKPALREIYQYLKSSFAASGVPLPDHLL